MYYYSIPCDFKIETLRRIRELNEISSDHQVIDVYGQLTQGYSHPSGRSSSALPQIDITQFKEYVKCCIDCGIRFDYTLNAPLMLDKSDRIKISELVLEVLETGIRHFTVAIPELMQIIWKEEPQAKIKASAICEIMTPDKARYYKDLGINEIVVDPDINRNFRRLKQICNIFGDGVQVLVNNTCICNCPYKMFHYNQEALNIGADEYYYRCAIQKASGLDPFIRMNWIRPEDTVIYHQRGIHYFKIQGRNNLKNAELCKTIQYYFEQDFDGNLMDLITLFHPYNHFQPYVSNKLLNDFLSPFYTKADFCTLECVTCGYCKKAAEKCMNAADTLKINQKAVLFYQSKLNQ